MILELGNDKKGEESSLRLTMKKNKEKGDRERWGGKKLENVKKKKKKKKV